MSFLSALFDQGKVYNFEHAFGARDITTMAMQEAIKDWAQLYYQTEPTKGEDPCQRIPAAIVSKLTKTTFSEYVATPTKQSDGTAFIVAVLAALERSRKKAMQQGLIGGQCFLKPIFDAQGLTFSVIPRGCYIPLGRDERDNVTDIGTAERTVQGRSYFTLLERRTVDVAGYLTIRNKLYMSDSDDTLGQEVSLNSLEKYALLVPEHTYTTPIHSLGLIPVRVPMENCVDGSPEPVAVYAPAVGLIHNINRNEALLNGEFDRGQSRIIVPDTMLKRGKDGRRGLEGNVFVGGPMLDSEGITIFSPELREASFLARKTEYLRNVESLIGLKRGLLSEVEASERTAKEITSSEGDYNLTIMDFQEMWEGAVREAVRVCDVLGRLYQVYNGPVIDPKKDVTISWGNGILYDEDQTWLDLKSMVAAGMLKPEIAVGWYFDMPYETPEDLQKIREKYMPQLQDLVAGEE